MIKKHLPLIVAIALPIIFIGILAVAILLPSMKINPQHDFVYTDARERNEYPYKVIQYKNDYVLKEGKVTLRPLNSKYDDITGLMKQDIELRDAPKLYYYSVTENTSREISLEDAQKLILVAGPSSPDGYNVKYEYNNDGIFELFGGSRDSGYVITKGAGRKNLSGMDTIENYYGGEEFLLIGWVN
jgi:hypothetical protein